MGCCGCVYALIIDLNIPKLAIILQIPKMLYIDYLAPLHGLIQILYYKIE